MDIEKASQRINDLRFLLNTYNRLFKDVKSSFYLCNSLSILIESTKKELEYLEEMRDSGEFYVLEDYLK